MGWLTWPAVLWPARPLLQKSAWTVNVTTLATTLTAKPAAETTDRSASFGFNAAGASGFECSLDGAAYTTCTSPKQYTSLGNGSHTFLVRAKSGSTAGPATRYVWHVINAAPTVTGDQVLMVVENSAVNVTLQGTDSDPLTYQIVAQPQHGILRGLAPNLTYVPNTSPCLALTPPLRPTPPVPPSALH